MSVFDGISPQKVWKFFELVCSIPHPSGHEAALAAKLAEVAAGYGLSCRQDAAGNLRIDRPGAPGFEKSPVILLQAHLDMVPLAENSDFDFTATAITPYIDGDWVRASGTTLGADDGIGVALAMALLCDKTVECGPVSALFTVDEEVGLTGASAVSPELLAGKYLINLDGGPHGYACIGCAGGARTEFKLTPEWENIASGSAVRITLSGMKGGHSGICIHENRGNAIKAMADFLLGQPELRIASLDAGQADNAIPAEIVCRAVFDGDIAMLKQSANLYAALLNRELQIDSVSVEVVPEQIVTEKVFSGDFQKKLLSALSMVPNGALEMDEQLHIVRSSSNMAAIATSDDVIAIRTSQRSLDDEQRLLTSAMITAHFEAVGAAAVSGNSYPGWKPQPESRLTGVCCDVWEKRSGKPMKLGAIHAGLETGAFSKKNPDLELISIGPEAHGCHTPQECLSISSTCDFYDYLIDVVKALA